MPGELLSRLTVVKMCNHTLLNERNAFVWQSVCMNACVCLHSCRNSKCLCHVSIHPWTRSCAFLSRRSSSWQWIEVHAVVCIQSLVVNLLFATSPRKSPAEPPVSAGDGEPDALRQMRFFTSSISSNITFTPHYRDWGGCRWWQIMGSQWQPGISLHFTHE